MTWRLETERLDLRPLTPEDLDAFALVVGDPHSMRFYPTPFDRDAARSWIGRTRERYAQDGYGLLAVVERATGELIGDCGPMLQPVDDERFVELGWHIRPDRQRLGFATEAAVACRDHAWATLDVDRLISLIRPENVPSWSVARKLGFRPWRPTVRAGVGHVVWSLGRP
ncbi:MAG TPA: GNAT family N-acetyltransferase [Actinomycetota bacterium]